MFTVEWNRAIWEQQYHWSQGGDEWSGSWGGVERQWQRTLLPRLEPFLPTGVVLEIGPGFGRWTQKLKNLCRRLHVVDLAPRCIESCRQRFRDCEHIEYHVNDGQSLPMIADRSIDFAFSFDSLVHVNRDVIRAYLGELARKLTADGVAFLHHSNLGEYARWPLAALLERWGWIERNRHYRAPDVSARTFVADARQQGLSCIRQELINWGGRRLIDCFSIVTRPGSRWDRPHRVIRNYRFWDETRS